MALHAVVPLKPLALAKSRLGSALAPTARRALVVEMFSRVVRSLRAAPRQLSCVWVTSADHEVLAMAEDMGARPLPDSGADLNDALERARTAVVAAGAAAMLVVPADVPLLSAADIAALAAALAIADVVLAPDAAGSGTNALGLRLPSPLSFGFGEGSAERHRRTAARHGLLLHEHRSPTLGLDVDDIVSLTRYRELTRLAG